MHFYLAFSHILTMKHIRPFPPKATSTWFKVFLLSLGDLNHLLVKGKGKDSCFLLPTEQSGQRWSQNQTSTTTPSFDLMLNLIDFTLCKCLVPARMVFCHNTDSTLIKRVSLVLKFLCFHRFSTLF